MKTVLITGCSSGFGAATPQLFAERGWNVVATMRDPVAGRRVTDQPNVLVARLDGQELSSIEAAVTTALERFGSIDALVNNAGFGLFGLFEGTDRDRVREQFDGLCEPKLSPPVI